MEKVIAGKDVQSRALAAQDGITIKEAVARVESFYTMLNGLLDQEGTEVRMEGLGTAKRKVREAHQARVPGVEGQFTNVPARVKIVLVSHPKNI